MNKTALELSPQEWQRYHPAEALARRKQQDQAQAAQRKQRAWQLAHQAAELLRNNFGAKKIVVFGSLAHEAWFTPWSDIDLAAWGIPPDRFYAAVGAVAELSSEFKIDLIDPETSRPALRAAIEREGREL
jgi:predicted nucleotidyltransferase